MKRKNRLWQLMGFATVSFAGTILHFLYDWTGQSVLVAPFSGVNESTWEHMKLLFFSMLAFAIVQSLFFRDREDFWCIKLKGVVLGLLLIPIIFYTYNGVIGRSFDWFNIAIFFISAAISFIYETKLLNENKMVCKSSKAAFALLCIIAVLFIVFTFVPPEIGIFKDPIDGSFGK